MTFNDSSSGNCPEFVVQHTGDDVGIALRELPAGDVLADGLQVGTHTVPEAHKIALHAIPAGAPIVKKNRIIALATRDISKGDWVHIHNVTDADPDLHVSKARHSSDMDISSANLPMVPNTFQGYRRADGRVGTRNFIAVCVAGNCAATAARRISEWFTPERLAPYPNVGGVIPLTHEFGCGMEMTGEPMDMLRRTLAASVRHPNVAGAVIVALGCERNNIYGFMEQEGLQVGPALQTVVLQEVGGTLSAVQQGVAAVKAMLPEANRARREAAPVSALTVGVMSHGLDGYAALTSTPAVALACDALVQAGGSIASADTPSVIRLADEVRARTITPKAAAPLLERLQWWREHHRGHDTRLRPGRLPQGLPTGISTMREQSALALDAMGHTPLQGMVAYGQSIPQAGWTHVDSPAYEAVSATGLVASGATLLCLATGLGSSFGAALSPTVKLATHTELYRRWADDIDLDAGVMLNHGIGARQMAQHIIDAWIKHANGEQTHNETLGVGSDEFAPWPVGVLA